MELNEETLRQRETGRAYYAAIGELAVISAQIDADISMYLSTLNRKVSLDTPGELTVNMVYGLSIWGKLNKLNNCIMNNMPEADKEFKDEWSDIYKRIFDIIDGRHRLIHGVITGFVFIEPIITVILDDDKKATIKAFYLSDIHFLIADSRKLFPFLSHIFWEKFKKKLGYGHLRTDVSIKTQP